MHTLGCQCWQQGLNLQFFFRLEGFSDLSELLKPRGGQEISFSKVRLTSLSAFPCIMGRNIIPVIHLTNSLPLQRHGPRTQVCLVCQPHFPSPFANSQSVVCLHGGLVSLLGVVGMCGSQQVCVPCQVIMCFQWFVALRIRAAVVCREECAAAFAAPVIPNWLVCSWSLGLLLPVLTASAAKSEGILQLVALLLQEREPNFWQS